MHNALVIMNASCSIRIANATVIRFSDIICCVCFLEYDKVQTPQDCKNLLTRQKAFKSKRFGIIKHLIYHEYNNNQDNNSPVINKFTIIQSIPEPFALASQLYILKYDFLHLHVSNNYIIDSVACLHGASVAHAVFRALAFHLQSRRPDSQRECSQCYSGPVLYPLSPGLNSKLLTKLLTKFDSISSDVSEIVCCVSVVD